MEKAGVGAAVHQGVVVVVGGQNPVGTTRRVWWWDSKAKSVYQMKLITTITKNMRTVIMWERTCWCKLGAVTLKEGDEQLGRLRWICSHSGANDRANVAIRTERNAGEVVYVYKADHSSL